jgi:inositol transport system ATP-binding protein
LFRLIGELRQRGTSVIYISHKLEEVFRLANRVTVLRDGMHVTTCPKSELTHDRLIALMVGRRLHEVLPKATTDKSDVALSIRGLSKLGRFEQVSFDVRCGEVVGLAGLMGAGRSDVVNAIYGLEPADSGEICVKGKTVHIRNSRDALDAGIGLVTEDRKVFGLVPTFDAQRNLTLAALRRWCRAGFIDREAENQVVDEQMQRFTIRGASRNQPVDRLSGGNQQKVVLARTLLAKPQILLLDEPTRGIDIAAKADVHALIAQLSRAGNAIVMVSSELPELLSLSDRILVMRQGQIAGEFSHEHATPEGVLKLAMPG